MKKLMIVVLLLLPFGAKAGELTGQLGPSLTLIGKISEPAGIVSVRDANIGLDGELAYFWQSLGVGVNLLLSTAQANVLGMDFDGSITGITAGPRYKLALAEKLAFLASAGVGNYTLEMALGHENSFGWMLGSEIQYSLTDKAYIAFKGTFHYISDIGGNDDATVFGFGPHIGLRF